MGGSQSHERQQQHGESDGEDPGLTVAAKGDDRRGSQRQDHNRLGNRNSVRFWQREVDHDLGSVGAGTE